MRRLVTTSYASSFGFIDSLYYLSLSLRFWKLFKSHKRKELEKWFAERFSLESENIYALNHARSGLYLFFESLNLNEGDEVIFTGFTCIAAVNPALWCGLKPVYADINRDSLLSELKDIKKVVTNRTKAIVIQHTFGKQVNIDPIMAYAKENGIVVIEDCAQMFGDKYLNSDLYVGSKADAAIFSFGREKMVSAVDGGILMINNDFYSSAIDDFAESLEPNAYASSLKAAVYPLIWYLFRLFTFKLAVSKAIHFLAAKSGLLHRATTSEEKVGKKPKSIPALMNDIQAEFALYQLKNAESISASHRTNYYEISQELDSLNAEYIHFNDAETPLRLPLLVEEGSKMRSFAMESKIQLGDWYNQPIGPIEVDLKNAQYREGDCKVAEEVSKSIVNIPLHQNLSKRDLQRIKEMLKQWYSNYEK